MTDTEALPAPDDAENPTDTPDVPDNDESDDSLAPTEPDTNEE